MDMGCAFQLRFQLATLADNGEAATLDSVESHDRFASLHTVDPEHARLVLEYAFVRQQPATHDAFETASNVGRGEPASAKKGYVPDGCLCDVSIIIPKQDIYVPAEFRQAHPLSSSSVLTSARGFGCSE